MKRRIKSLIAGLIAVVLLSSNMVFADDFTENNPTTQWAEYGVMPQIGIGALDWSVTNNAFATVLYNLLMYDIEFDFGASYISQYQAIELLTKAMSIETPEISTSDSILTFRGLAEVLNKFVPHFINNAPVVNFSNEILNGSMIIKDSNNTNSIVANINGTGNIIIIPMQDINITLDNINIAGNIIVMHGNGSVVNITVNNVSANKLHILSTASVNVVGNSRIEEIKLMNTSWLSTAGQLTTAIRTNLYIATEDVQIYGRFNNVKIDVENAFAPIAFPFDGQIEYLMAKSDVILIGDVDVAHYEIANSGSFNTINEQGMYRRQQMQNAIDESINNAMADMMNQLLAALVSVITQSLSPNLPPNFNTGNITPPEIIPPNRDPDPTPER